MQENRRKIIAIAVLGLLLVVFWGGARYEAWRHQQEESTLTVIDETVGETVASEVLEAPEKIVVHVAGAVNNAGVYEMEEGDRVEDALNKAGLTEQSAPDGLNRAQLLTDGQKIVVPSIEEISAAGVANNGAAVYTSETDKVSINQGDKTSLMTLNGIGEVKAQAIIDYRNKNGGFKSLEELKNVKGIGEKTYAGLVDDITL